jgi:hypothetical protein
MPISNKLRQANQFRRSLYHRAKQQGLNVQWSMKTDRMQQIYADHLRVSAIQRNARQNIVSSYQRFISNRTKQDNEAINAINHLTGTIEIPLSRFNRIFHKIHAPADKYLLVNLKDIYGSIIQTYNIQNYNINADGLFITEHEGFSSDADADLDILPTTSIMLEWMTNPKRSHSERKNFFPYFTHENYQLNDFQVYIQSEKQSEVPCFLFALEKAGVDTETIKQITQTMLHSGATIDFIRKTATTFELHIVVKQFREESTSHKRADTTHYGPKDKETILLGSVGKHLFAITDTKITKHALTHPEFASHEKFPSIVIDHGYVMKNPKKIKFLDSYDVISYLYLHRDERLTPITQSNTPRLLNNEYQQVQSLSEEDFVESNFKEIGRVDGKMMNGLNPFRTRNPQTKKFEEVEDFNIVYFDFETFPIDAKHTPYCIAFKINEKPTQIVYGFDCAEKFLQALPKQSCNLLWAHNAGFDMRFIVKHLTAFKRESNIIETGTRLKQLHGFYRGREIIIKDTMSFINAKLAKLPSMFPNACNGFTLEKESFPHDLINQDNFESMWKMSDLESFMYKDVLITNATKIGAIKDGKFDAKMYAIHYCKRDVDVLASCFEAFRNMFIERFSQDVYRFMSMPSLAYAIQHNEGCFDDCFAMRGVPLAFARQAIVGGRVMTRDNEKQHTKHQISDFDAVSLYPSSQSVLKGYIRGIPKMFKNAIPAEADDYIVRVKFDSISKKRHFPLLSIKDASSRNFTNDIVGKILVVGKQALEDVVEFQGATYTVIEGMYWTDGFNDQITKTIKDLFTERLRLKAEKNPLQEGIKLLMNSAYGKLIQKPIIKQKIFVKGVYKIAEYSHKNIHKLISRTMISDDLALIEEHKAVFEHWSPAHLGVQVLDMSKHLMNQVMCLAEDNDAKIWYQDTDSMHIDRCSLDALADAFRAKYGRELVGKDLCQFHSDFELKGSKGEVFATESIFLGKKSYLDILACDGNDSTGMHIRMKGIPSLLLSENTRETYMSLFEGTAHEFDLAKLCSIEINTKTQNITKRFSFKRKVQFN